MKWQGCGQRSPICSVLKPRLHRTPPFLYLGVEVEFGNQAVMDLPRDIEQVGHESGDALVKLGHVGMTVQIAALTPTVTAPVTAAHMLSEAGAVTHSATPQVEPAAQPQHAPAAQLQHVPAAQPQTTTSETTQQPVSENTTMTGSVDRHRKWSRSKAWYEVKRRFFSMNEGTLIWLLSNPRYLAHFVNSLAELCVPPRAEAHP